MNRNEVLSKLQSIFDDVFLEPVKVTPELTAKEVEEWTSLMHISLLVTVEKAFAIRFRVGEVEKTKNVGEFADVIVRRLNQP
jgi:acyl carrier protein